MKARLINDVSGIINCEYSPFEAEFEALAEIKEYDEYTYLHSLNVARLSVGLGKRLEFNNEMIVDLGWAALLHDLGKLKVPIDILNKATKFSPEEKAIMLSHPLESLAVFSELQSVSLDRLRRLSAAFEHHQRFDLKGYPIVHKKHSIHPYSRIVAIADTFDAMTTDRIYQRRTLPDVALKIMAQGFGSVFDPILLQAFITSLGAYPVGTLVRLNDERLAVVMNYHDKSELDRPIVMGVEYQKEIDLSKTENKEIKIVSSEFPEDYDINIDEVLESNAR